MHTVLVVTFWTSLALLSWIYMGYPLVALAYGRLRPVRVTAATAWPALVTVGIAVHDGANDIEARVQNILEQAPPFEMEVIVASDGSTDETAQIVRRLAGSDARIRLLDLPRVGQSAAQTEIFKVGRGEIVVLTDKETRCAPDCLANLVQPFADPRVGCTTGVIEWRYDRNTPTARHEGSYWRYEQFVRAAESQAGWLAAMSGPLMAARASLFRPVPAHVSLDQMLPLIAREDGLLVLVVPSAVVSDRGTSSALEQFRSRIRCATQGIEANLSMTWRIKPWRRPGSFLSMWSHKLLRWATPFPAALAVVSGIGLTLLGDSVGYLVPAVGLAVVLLLALLGNLATRAGRTLPLTGLGVTVFSVNLAFARSWLNVLLGRRVGKWESAPADPEAG